MQGKQDAGQEDQGNLYHGAIAANFFLFPGNAPAGAWA